MKTLPNNVVKKLLLEETWRRTRRAIIFHSIRGTMAMIGTVWIVTGLLNSAGVPRLWQILLSPASAGVWALFRRWMTRGMTDERPRIIPVSSRDIEGAG